MKPTVVAVDPGKLSGVVVYDFDRSEIILDGEYGQFRTCNIIDTEIEKAVQNRYPIHIVLEQFVQLPGPIDAGPWSLEIIGTARYLAEKSMYNLDTYFDSTQSPSAAKSVAPNLVLKEIGFWYTGGHGHANDAYRHLVLYGLRKSLFTQDEIRKIMGVQVD